MKYKIIILKIKQYFLILKEEDNHTLLKILWYKNDKLKEIYKLTRNKSYNHKYKYFQWKE